MKQITSLFLTVVALGALGACGSDDTCLPTCAGDRNYDALAYNLRGNIDWITLEMAGFEDITVALADSPVIELDATMKIQSVRASERDVPFAVAGPDADHPEHVRVDLSGVQGVSDPVTFTVAYTAQPSDTLRIGEARDDDPNHALVEYTDSEPDRARQWLVCKDDPSDRALWSVEMTLPGNYDLLANGARRFDEPSLAGHRVRYELDKPLPTYLMAFAAGDIVHEERTTGRVPLAVWHRRGLPLDANATLDAVADAMATFESLVGPYPWDSYTVFLAPLYGGGMENATITFNLESSGLGNVSFGLNAHELAHHWFGDWVTMRRYEDVWVKEGMATLLAAEAQRARRDKAGGGRLFGEDFTFSPSDAIVDPELHGLDKYTTGPYERAAWTITQIRSLVGEQAFWASLRQVLADHALDSITGEEFLSSFGLDPAQVAQLTTALTTHDVPQLTVTSTPGNVMLSLADPGGTMIAPLGVTAVDAAGATTARSLVPGTPLAIAVPTGGYLALDEADVHPYPAFSFEVPAYDDIVAVELPGTAAATTAFGMRSAAVQETALGDAGLPSTAPADVTALYNALDSTAAQRQVVFAGCNALGSLPASDASALVQALQPLAAAPAVQLFNSTYATCGTALPAAQLAGEITTLADSVTPATAGRLDYLMAFDYGPAASLAVLSKIATTAPTLALRDRAVTRLGLQASGRYSDVPAADVPAWQAFFRGRLGAVTSQTRLLAIWRGVVGLADVSALPLVAPLLHEVLLSGPAQRQIVCDAFAIAAQTPGAWEAFQAAAQPWDTLAADAQSALADPSVCNGARRAPAALRGKAAREARD